MALHTLFRPGRIGALELKNRIVKSPQTTALSNPDGTVTDRTINHYRRLAEGGVGLVLVEYTYVDDFAGKSVHNQIGASRREHIAGLGRLTDEVHAAGARIGLQLEHCGRQKFLGTEPIRSASDVSWNIAEAPHGVRPKALTREEIAEVVTAFADAAARAVDARFDLVEIHAGHGYLITNFLSPHTNKRDDEYGGDFAGRSRLLLEIVEAVRARIPASVPLSVRLSITDYEPDGIPAEETVELAVLLEARGVDVLHMSGGHHALMQYEVSPWFMPRAPHRWGWELLRGKVSIPVIASGSLVSPELAAEVLESGAADFVSLGRAMLADPDWAEKARTGRTLEITPCIRCNDGCLHRGINAGRSVGCTVNPHVGHEYRFEVLPAPAPRRVAVAGGGAAGLRAAAVLADRGHEVTLFSGGALGGGLVPASIGPGGQDLRALVDHLVHEVKRRGVDVRHEAATVDTVERGAYDSVFVATGIRRRAVPGVEATDGRDPAGPRVLSARAAAADPAAVVAPVAVVGGGWTGARTALALAESGTGPVTLVEKRSEILGADEVFTDTEFLPGMLAERNVTVLTGTEAVAADRDGLRVGTAAGERVLPAATVIVAAGHDPRRELADELAERLPAVDVTVIGGARTGGRVFDALHEAFFAARLH